MTWRRKLLCTRVCVWRGDTESQRSPPWLSGGVLQTIKAQVDKHLSNPADGGNIVIIYGLPPVTVITSVVDDLKHRWWWETKQTAAE